LSKFVQILNFESNQSSFKIVGDSNFNELNPKLIFPIHKSLREIQLWILIIIENKPDLLSSLNFQFNSKVEQETRNSIEQFEILKLFCEHVLFLMPQNIHNLKEISNFIGHLFFKIPIDPCCFVVSLMYFIQLKSLSSNNFMDYFCCCLMIACKMWEDVKYPNILFFREFHLKNLTLKEWNVMEMKLLDELEFKLFISKEDFETFIKKRKFSKKLLKYLEENFSKIE
jgi:hypothetical protein